MDIQTHYLDNNTAFTQGQAVTAHFFKLNGKTILAEDTYFYIMSSMRRMRMKIPMKYTLEYFTFLINNISNQNKNGIHQLIIYPNQDESINHWEKFTETKNICTIQKEIEIDIQKEISVNTHFISNIRTYSPENCYAKIYAKENDLDDVILLNPNKKIARTIHGNLLLLKDNDIQVVKPSQGAYISPLMESFITHIHKNKLANITETEIAPFQTQQADEILMVSDSIGIMSVKKIRTKTFQNQKFTELLNNWAEIFNK